VPATGRQLALTGDDVGESSPTERSRRRRLATAVETNGAGDPGARARTGAPRDLAGPCGSSARAWKASRRSKEQLRAELGLLRGEAEVYDGPPSIFVTGWFRRHPWC